MKNKLYRSRAIPPHNDLSTFDETTSIAELRQMQAESARASQEGLKAMKRIASKIVGQDSGQAHYLRSLLLSLYNGTPTRLCLVGNLDWSLRRDICAVVLGVHQGEFDDYKIREAFVSAGDHEAAWFLAGIPEANESY